MACDILELPLFVYGTLLCGERAFGYLAAHSVRHLPAHLPNARLYTTGAYPLAVTVPPWRSTDGEATVVFGELHWLASTNYGALLQQLDRYEGDEYMRFIRDVITVEGSAVRAWVYLGEAVHAAQFPLIAGGDWRKRAGHVGD